MLQHFPYFTVLEPVCTVSQLRYYCTICVPHGEFTIPMWVCVFPALFPFSSRRCSFQCPAYRQTSHFHPVKLTQFHGKGTGQGVRKPILGPAFLLCMRRSTKGSPRSLLWFYKMNRIPSWVSGNAGAPFKPMPSPSSSRFSRVTQDGGRPMEREQVEWGEGEVRFSESRPILEVWP